MGLNDTRRWSGHGGIPTLERGNDQMLRTILEKTASFHGHKNFSVCIKQDDDDPDGILHTRLINILSHGNYSLFEPQQMLDENKQYFRKILNDFLSRYPFNPELFPEEPLEVRE